jgi:N-hydroxyarylamine O-acetyltransferase
VKNERAWVNRYLDLLGLQRKPPSYGYLSEICRAHLHTFAFENISKLLYYRDRELNGFLIPPADIFVENRSRYHFGGTCFTLNSRLHLLLEALGFDAYLVKLGKDHMGILVQLPELPDERLYVDCGAAAPIFQPVRFERDAGNVSAFGMDEIRIVPVQEEPGQFRFVRYRRGEVVSSEWTFDPAKKQSFSDFHPIIEQLNEPGTVFMSSLRCQLWQTQNFRSLSLVNNVLTIRDEKGMERKETLHSIEEIEHVMAEEFQLPLLPVREAAAILKSLGTDIFADNTPFR